ncbi:Neuropeptide-Like Protein [Caenorhabditis elegans]|uniref:Neuropeptide-Like Protein n=1 Tax=Caenorhabditis elegans TaxID=6239 RepID=Q20348_CAEEL|nr:Neuropeptide-Like Protein [Caenorhabditis elegans]CCD61885.2 Neuropeptide-Like Protein [Caenorhabditis elegans]|eukprot:NP_001334194.1 Neuropeptide-Like Protein [Caenorhabditis elegans]
MFRTLLICFFLMAAVSITSAYILDYDVPERQTRGDVKSVFFSPFRMVGKRSQFYGLYKQLGHSKRETSLE